MPRIAVAAGLALATLIGGITGASAQTALPATRPAPTASLDRLQVLFDDLRNRCTAEQYAQIRDAINASPALLQHFAALANAVQFAGFVIAEPTRPQSSPFANTIEQRQIVLTGEFLTQLVKRRLIQTPVPNEILPANLAFVLGSFAFHLTAPPAAARTENDALALIHGLHAVG